MRIACVQFAPLVGDVENNLTRADAVLSKADPMDLENLDLLVLPELAFTGYNFHSLQHIMPYLEPSGSGISSLWARTTALKYDCTVAVGYPEKVDVAKRWPASPEYYNSLIVVNGDGETVANYRKTFLYYTDESWALEGPGFFAEDVEDLGQVVVGICMDINPWRFEAPWHAFEFAFHILEVEANLVIVSMAWLTREDSKTFTRISDEPDMESLTYWVQRLEPVIRAEKEEEVIVVFCNRCGVEGEALYSGTSAVIGVKGGEVNVYGLLGRGVKETLIVDTDQPPFAKLINRPDAVEEPSSVPPPAFAAIPEQRDSVGLFDNDYSMTTPKSQRFEHEEVSPRGGFGVEVRPESDPVVVEDSYHTLPHTSEHIRPEHIGVAHSGHDYEDRHYRDRTEQLGSFDSLISEDSRGSNEVAYDVEVSPICPSPTPMSARPRLAIDTGPESLSPITGKLPPPGMPPGNHFASRDLYTPPLSSEETTVPIARHFQTPVSAAIYTPEEPVWPITDPSAKIDFKRTPSRTMPSRPSSRTQQVKRSELRSPLVEDVFVRTETKSRNQERAKIAEPWSAIEPRRSNTDPFDPYQARSQSAFDAAGSIRNLESKKSARPRRPSKANPDPVGFDQAEDWYRAKVTSSIHIVASPSVFQTTFPADIFGNSGDFAVSGSLDQEVLRDDPRPKSRLSHRGRSQSIAGVEPVFSENHEPMPPAPQSSTFPILPSPTKASQPRQPSRSVPEKYAASAAATALAPEVLAQMQAFTIREDEAHGRKSSREKGRSRRGTSRSTARRRSQSMAPEQTTRIPMSPYDLRSPMSV